MSFWLTLCSLPLLAGQQSESKPKDDAVPKYDVAAEKKFKVIVDEVKDRECPISHGLGSHLLVKADNKTYEVHVAPTKLVKDYEAVFQKGDELEITGIKTTFQGVDAILVREIKHGNDTFVFRDPQGKPIW
jgi:DNA/RNA endonuclease YhcR with UshA esterase domain